MAIPFDFDTLAALFRTMARIRAFERRGRARQPGRRRGVRQHASGGARCAGRCTCPPGRRRWPPACAPPATRQTCSTSTHRGHGHTLAKGADLARMMAELFGRASGFNGGKGGSMHIADFSVGMLGANGVVAAGLPIAVGAAHALKLRGAPHVVACFFGDGAINRGPFLEALNWAAVYALPVLFVCEDNRWSATTPATPLTAGDGAAARARALGIAAATVDGNDVQAVHASRRRLAAPRPRRRGAALAACADLPLQGPRLGRPGALPRPEELAAALRDDPLALRPRRAGATPAARPARWMRSMRRARRGRAAVAAPPRHHARGHCRLRPRAEHRRRGLAMSTARPPKVRIPARRRRRSAKGAHMSARTMSYAEAATDALAGAMAADPRVVVLGEDVGRGGIFGQYAGLAATLRRGASDRHADLRGHHHGRRRRHGAGGPQAGGRDARRRLRAVRDGRDRQPGGEEPLHVRRPGPVPLVLRMPIGIWAASAAQHSQSFESWFAHVPGLVVVCPRTPQDNHDLLRAALDSGDPVVYMEHKELWGQRGEVDPLAAVLGQAARRASQAADLTLVSWSRQMHQACAAAADAGPAGHRGRTDRPAHASGPGTAQRCSPRRARTQAAARRARGGAGGGLRRRGRRQRRRRRYRLPRRAPGRAAHPGRLCADAGGRGAHRCGGHGRRCAWSCCDEAGAVAGRRGGWPCCAWRRWW